MLPLRLVRRNQVPLCPPMNGLSTSRTSCCGASAKLCQQRHQMAGSDHHLYRPHLRRYFNTGIANSQTRPQDRAPCARPAKHYLVFIRTRPYRILKAPTSKRIAATVTPRATHCDRPHHRQMLYMLPATGTITSRKWLKTWSPCCSKTT